LHFSLAVIRRSEIAAHSNKLPFIRPLSRIPTPPQSVGYGKFLLYHVEN
jgi:hypothetical protein